MEPAQLGGHPLVERELGAREGLLVGGRLDLVAAQAVAAREQGVEQVPLRAGERLVAAQPVEPPRLLVEFGDAQVTAHGEVDQRRRHVDRAGRAVDEGAQLAGVHPRRRPELHGDRGLHRGGDPGAVAGDGAQAGREPDVGLVAGAPHLQRQPAEAQRGERGRQPGGGRREREHVADVQPLLVAGFGADERAGRVAGDHLDALPLRERPRRVLDGGRRRAGVAGAGEALPLEAAGALAGGRPGDRDADGVDRDRPAQPDRVPVELVEARGRPRFDHAAERVVDDVVLDAAAVLPVGRPDPDDQVAVVDLLLEFGRGAGRAGDGGDGDVEHAPDVGVARHLLPEREPQVGAAPRVVGEVEVEVEPHGGETGGIEGDLLFVAWDAPGRVLVVGVGGRRPREREDGQQEQGEDAAERLHASSVAGRRGVPTLPPAARGGQNTTTQPSRASGSV